LGPLVDQSLKKNLQGSNEESEEEDNDNEERSEES